MIQQKDDKFWKIKVVAHTSSDKQRTSRNGLDLALFVAKNAKLGVYLLNPSSRITEIKKKDLEDIPVKRLTPFFYYGK